MKRSRRGICAATAAIAVFGLAVHTTANYIFAQHTYTIFVDPLLSNQVCKDITAFIMHHKPNNLSSEKLTVFMAQVFQQFACVKKIDIAYCAPRTLLIEVHAKKPLLKMNDALVVTDDQSVVNYDFFAQHHVNYLPHITACYNAQDKVVSQELYSCIQDLVALDKDYSVNWINPYEIRLADKHQELFSIMCESHHMPTAQLLQKCQRLKSDLENQGVFVAKNTKKISQKWVADVRFAQQIIVYSETSGGTYG